MRALQWLAQREHSPQQLRAKLLRAAMKATGEGSSSHEEADAVSEVDALISWLEANGHLSQSRFVESRVHALQGHYGNRRIDDELRRHAVVADDETRQTLRATELERASQVWRRKFGVAATDAAGLSRQMRFLVGRGFSSDVVHQVVRAAASGEPSCE